MAKVRLQPLLGDLGLMAGGTFLLTNLVAIWVILMNPRLDNGLEDVDVLLGPDRQASQGPAGGLASNFTLDHSQFHPGGGVLHVGGVVLPVEVPPVFSGLLGCINGLSWAADELCKLCLGDPGAKQRAVLYPFLPLRLNAWTLINKQLIRNLHNRMRFLKSGANRGYLLE